MANQVIWMTASAGAGKTTALVNRYQDLLTRHKPEEIIGITFTVHAAQEMCRRLDASSRFRIQTIHSLCHQILSHHWQKEVHILDPHEKTLLIQQAIRMALNEPTALTQQLAKKFSPYYLYIIIEKILAKWRPDLSKENPEEFASTDQAPPSFQPSEQIMAMVQHHPLIQQLQTQYQDVFLTKSGDVRKRILDAATVKAYPEWDDIFKAEAQRIYDWHQERAIQEWFDQNALTYQLVKRVWEHYITLKQHLKDYDELLLETKNLLEDDTIRYSICKNIHHVLLDEAQDTNPRQWRIIELLTQHLFDDIHTDNSFFVVGDHKQSIYGFQDVRPEFLAQQKKKYQVWAGAGFLEKTLETNYRSVKEVCDYVATQCLIEDHPTIARSHQGFVLEVNNFDEALGKFLQDPPFLPSQNRYLELGDIMILCRKRDKTYRSLIDAYPSQIRYEENQLLHELPDIQLLMHKALQMAQPDNSYAAYKLSTYTSSQDFQPTSLFDLVHHVLDHNQSLLDLMLTFMSRYRITTPQSLYWWLRAYPYSLKTISTKDPNTMQLLTIHGSKGLQAPVVFVFNDWNTHHQQDIWWNYETGNFALPPTQNIHHPILSNIRQQNIKAQKEEEARLRYVAFTRAMDVLVVVNSGPDKDG